MPHRTVPAPIVTMLFTVSVLALIADIALILVGGYPGLAKPLGVVGCVGVLAAVWVAHATTRR